MYKLLHEKANALQSIYEISEDLSEQMAHVYEDGPYDDIIALLDARKAKMDEVDECDRRMHLLGESGYTPPDAEADAQIGMERTTIRTLLEKIKALDEKNADVILTFMNEVSSGLKDVQNGRRSVTAYAPLPDEEEGFQLDTLQ